MDDVYLMIRQPAKAETKVKGSRFIAEAEAVTAVDDALTKLAAIRKREYSATHHCYAYIVGRGQDATFKYSDDGEPGGSAGKPIYDVVAGTGVTNVLCVVTRYFGGTKLGTGGLVRAYGDAARAAMTAAGVKECFLTRRFRFTFDFNLYDRWLQAVHRLGAEVLDTRYSDHIEMDARIRLSRAPQLIETFTELTSGKGIVEEIESHEHC
jgi:uncharacterized YigZ family protein